MGKFGFGGARLSGGGLRRRVITAGLAVSVLAGAASVPWLLANASKPAHAQDVLVLPKETPTASDTTSDPTNTFPNYFSPTPQSATASVSVEEVSPLPAPLRIVRGLEEPLVATGGTTHEEDAALQVALTAFSDQTTSMNATAAPVDFANLALPLEAFLTRYPASGWAMAVQTNLGLGYYHAGYFSRAFTAWESAWRLGRHTQILEAKRLTDRAVGELARMHARVGHADKLEALFADLGDRKVTGAATEFITGAREGASVMRNRPGIAYLCGSKALANVLRALKATPEQITVVDAAQSSPKGFSLTQVSELANKAGLAHKLIYRGAGQPVPLPSVVNWKVNHYAAIVEIKDGKYHVQDPTFASGDLWLTQAAIDAESSGYFLAPIAATAKAAPTGWRDVAPQSDEAKAVYGMGRVTDGDPGDTMTTSPKMHESGLCHGMCGYNTHMKTISLNLTDTPLGYTPSKGTAVMMTLTYNQREAGQPANFSFGNVSPKWSHNWLAFVEDDPATTTALPITHPGGGGYIASRTLRGFNTVNYLNPEWQTGAVLYRLPSNTTTTSYERRFPDGSKEVYARSDNSPTYPRRWFLTKKVDAQGLAVTIAYDTQSRITGITDAAGNITTFSYANANPLLISRVTDPFGRFITLAYDGNGQLVSITDAIGIVSSFGYDGSGLINVLTTPYGNSGFAYGVDPIGPGNNIARWLEATDPFGNAERVVFSGYTSVLAASESAALFPSSSTATLTSQNGSLNTDNTFHWGRHVYPTTHTDYAQAVTSHWSTTQPEPASLLSLKNPLESRLWFNHPLQEWSGYSYSSGAVT